MAGAPYLAPALAQLRNEINEEHPHRDRSSDGWIGDADHAARVSDHNADPVTKVVRALDVDHDGIDKVKLRQTAFNSPRTEYVIQDWKIYRRATGFKAEKYTGTNGHTGHTHISIRHGSKWENDRRSWVYRNGGVVGGPTQPPVSGAKSVSQLADEVMRGQWGNNPLRAQRLRAEGYDPEAVQAEVNRRSGHQPAPSKSVQDLAQEVLSGAWGNDPERTERLTAAGYNAHDVQVEVNRRLAAGAPAASRPSLFEVAQQVIKGQWGNGKDRKHRLESAGYSYQQIQDEVNRQLR